MLFRKRNSRASLKFLEVVSLSLLGCLLDGVVAFGVMGVVAVVGGEHWVLVGLDGKFGVVAH